MRTIAPSRRLVPGLMPWAILGALLLRSGVTLKEVQGHSRMPQVLATRWAAGYLLRRWTDLSYPDIAREIRPPGTSHTQVASMSKYVMQARDDKGTDRSREARALALALVKDATRMLRQQAADDRRRMVETQGFTAKKRQQMVNHWTAWRNERAGGAA